MIVIGSRALMQHVPLQRAPEDLDVVGTYAEFARLSRRCKRQRPVEGGKKYQMFLGKIPVEFEITWPGSTAEMIAQQVYHDPQRMQRTIFGETFAVASLDLLLTLKMAHRFKKHSKYFLKTMRDIHLLRSRGAKVPENCGSLLAARTAEAMNYAHPKLNVSKADFFNPNVQYIYDHDSIHKVMAIGTQPAYTWFKPVDSEVLTSRKMFEALPLETRRHAVLEESYVLALERSQVPHRGKITPRDSFLIALERVCTSITSGWFREFAWENYDAILMLYDNKYADRFFAVARTVPLHTSAGPKGTGFAADDQVTGGLR